MFSYGYCISQTQGYHMEENFVVGKTLANLAIDHKFAKFSNQIFCFKYVDLEYNINFENIHCSYIWSVSGLIT